MANKMTIREGFEKARAVFEQMGDAEMVAFFDKRIEQNAKKSTTERKLTPHQLENERIKEGIVLPCLTPTNKGLIGLTYHH